MGIFNLFKKKKDVVGQGETQKNSREKDEKNDYSVLDLGNCMLSSVRKDEIIKKSHVIPWEKLSKTSPIAISTVNNIKAVVQQNRKSSNNLYQVINLGKNDSLKAMKDGKTFWGAIKHDGGTSTMAKLKKVNSNNLVSIDPTAVMMSVVLANINEQLEGIKELSQKIFSFLEQEKESEIESDLEILNKSINDFRFNFEDEKYLLNSHKQVMDIKRTANKNMLFYKKEINSALAKDKLFTTSKMMNSIIDEIQKKFEYYRLSLYIYSFSSFIEILILGNYQNEYLLSRKEEIKGLDAEYSTIFNNALEYVKKNADKSLEGNVLSGLGNAEKSIGNLAEKIKAKNVDIWLNEKGDCLKQSGQNIKDGFATRFDEIKVSNSKLFVDQIEKLDGICNKTNEIYFDGENLYLK